MGAKGKAFSLAGIEYLFEEGALSVGEHNDQRRFHFPNDLMQVGRDRPGLIHYFEVDVGLDMEFLFNDFFEEVLVGYHFVRTHQMKYVEFCPQMMDKRHDLFQLFLIMVEVCGIQQPTDRGSPIPFWHDDDRCGGLGDHIAGMRAPESVKSGGSAGAHAYEVYILVLSAIILQGYFGADTFYDDTVICLIMGVCPGEDAGSYLTQSALAQVQLFGPESLVLFFTPPCQACNICHMKKDEHGFLLSGPLDGESHARPRADAEVCRDQYL